MKKILSFLAAGALALGLIGCSGDLHDNVPRIIDLSQGGVAGDFDSPANWSEKEPWTTADASTATYTFNFTTKADSASDIGFKINSQLKWNVDGYTEFNVSADGAAATASFMKGADMAGAGNAQILGVKPSTSYVMTVVCNPDTTATVTVVSTGSGSSDPVPYYLDGMFFLGCPATGNGFTCNADALLWNPTVTKKTGEVLYTKDFTFGTCTCDWHTGVPTRVKISTSDWNSSYGDTPIAVGEDFVQLVKDGGNSDVTGLTEGKAYRAEVLTNPDKEVFIKIYEVAQVKLTFQAVGLETGYEAWINGTFWGSSWPNGWPIASWGTLGDGFTTEDIPEADETGVAKFNNKFDVTAVAKTGDKLSYNFKAIACEDDKWEAVKLDSGDLTCDVTVDGEGTYLVSVDIEAGEVTVKKQ